MFGFHLSSLGKVLGSASSTATRSFAPRLPWEWPPPPPPPVMTLGQTQSPKKD